MSSTPQTSDAAKTAKLVVHVLYERPYAKVGGLAAVRIGSLLRQEEAAGEIRRIAEDAVSHTFPRCPDDQQDDIVQEVYVRLLRRFGATSIVEITRSLRGFIYGCARNFALQINRSLVRRTRIYEIWPLLDACEATDPHPDPAIQAEHRELEEMFSRMFADRLGTDGIAFAQLSLRNVSIATIALKLGVSPVTAYRLRDSVRGVLYEVFRELSDDDHDPHGPRGGNRRRAPASDKTNKGPDAARSKFAAALLKTLRSTAFRVADYATNTVRANVHFIAAGSAGTDKSPFLALAQRCLVARPSYFVVSNGLRASREEPRTDVTTPLNRKEAEMRELLKVLRDPFARHLLTHVQFAVLVEAGLGFMKGESKLLRSRTKHDLLNTFVNRLLSFRAFREEPSKTQQPEGPNVRRRKLPDDGSAMICYDTSRAGGSYSETCFMRTGGKTKHDLLETFVNRLLSLRAFQEEPSLPTSSQTQRPTGCKSDTDRKSFMN